MLVNLRNEGQRHVCLLWQNRHDTHIGDAQILDTMNTERWIDARVRVTAFTHLHCAGHVPDGDDVAFNKVLQRVISLGEKDRCGFRRKQTRISSSELDFGATKGSTMASLKSLVWIMSSIILTASMQTLRS